LRRAFVHLGNVVLVSCAVGSSAEASDTQENQDDRFGGLPEVCEQQSENKAEHGEQGEKHGVYELGHGFFPI
jgi:hypothetical protein